MSQAVSMPAITHMPDDHPMRKLPMIGGVVGGVGLLAAVGLAFTGESKDFFFSYTVAYLYFLSIALGSLFFVIIHHASSAGWSVVVRRIAENAMYTLPAMAVLFIPVAVGYHDLWHHWVDPEVVANDPVLQGKQAYLNVPFFFGRAVLYFALWSLLAWFFRGNSVAQDESGDPALTTKMRMRSYPSIAVFALTISFAAIDWIMSMDPHWFSTMWGVYFFSGSALSMFSFLALVGLLMRRAGLLGDAISIEHYHDIGKYMFGFVVFWTYIAFSQFMLIWYANLPEETIWFEHRMEGSWLTISYVLIACHFVIPFFYTLPRTIKRIPNLLLCGAIWILVLHYVDLYWMIMPIHHHHGPHFGLLDVACMVGIGGLFVAVFSHWMGKSAMIPVKDPFLQESLSFENF